MPAKLHTAPLTEPISLTEAKKHLRLAITDADAEAYTVKDDSLAAIITAAREYVEVVTRRGLITQTWTVQLDEFPYSNVINFPLGDLQSVDSVSYTDSEGNAATFTDFEVDTYHDGIYLKYGSSWPTVQSGSKIYIQYVVGYGDDASDVPGSIKRAMLLIIGHYHENTEDVLVGSSIQAIRLPLGVDCLLAGYKRMEF